MPLSSTFFDRRRRAWLSAAPVFVMLGIGLWGARGRGAEPDAPIAESKSGLEAVKRPESAQPSQFPSLDVELHSPSARDAKSKKLISAVAFSLNAQERLLARRALRLAWLPAPPAPPEVDAPAFNAIDRFIASRWKQAGLKSAQSPPDVCEDAAFLRRVYLDVIGVIPTLAEAQRFLSDTAPDKRAKLIEELLARHEDYAAHRTPYWEDALASATAPLQGGIPTRGNYRDWIFHSFLTNKPYDLMVAELIDPSMPGHKKAGQANANGRVYTVAYVRNDTHTDTIQSAANVAQVFLGTGMKCASCHNHFENKEWPQARFLAFAGMFAGKDLELIRCEERTGQFIPASFPFELPDAPTNAPPDAEGRLHRLTQLLIDPTNPRFAKTMVNRLWKRYLGLGLFEPADDFRLDRPASHPELLDWLADDFIRSGFDLKHAIRLILNSRTYQLRYDPQRGDRFDVAKPDQPRYFQSPSLRRLTAEQVMDSLRVATSQTLDPKQRLYLDKTSTALMRALGRPASRNEISTSRPDDVAVVQALEFLNGEEFSKPVYESEILKSLSETNAPAHCVERLYRAALSRSPSAAEMQLGVELLSGRFPRESRTRSNAEEIVWLDDAIPSGGVATGSAGADSWKWGSKPGQPVFSGEKSHSQGGEGVQRQHFIIDAKEPLKIGPEDSFFAYVYLDPQRPPREIMMQWNDGDWEHRAFWGQNLIRLGEDGAASRRPMGALPKGGEWVRLEVRAGEVGFQANGAAIVGWSFDQLDGVVYWDKAGVIQERKVPMNELLGDLLWALLASPEFQYVR